MDLTIEHRLTEEEGKRLWHKAFLAFAAPGYVLGVIYILIGISLGLHHKDLAPFC